MKCFDGQNDLVFERKTNGLTVFLTGTQVKQEESVFIKSKFPLVSSQDERFAYQLTYELFDDSKTLSQLSSGTKSDIERLELALKLKDLFSKPSEYLYPFVHPENIYSKDNHLEFVHYGLKGSLSPMEQEETYLLSQYKALVFSLLNPKISYENFVNGESSLKDKWSQKLAASGNIEVLHQLIQTEWQKEKQKEIQSLAKVPKGRYKFFKYAGSLALVAALSLGVLTFIDRSAILPEQEAITKAQADFISNHYDKTLEDLKTYKPEQLSKEARFVLASSSVNLADLNQTQKSAILNNISSTTDNNTLNFWIYQGRGRFEKSLNLAKNIGDDQLTLLAYTDLYQATKLNTTMNGDEKQKRLEGYNKQIQELSKSLGK